MPSQRRAVTGNQFVDEDKQAFAKRLRREMTPQEAALWDRIRGRKLGGFKFRRQQVIDGFIADFYCADAALVVEVDGEVHQAQIQYDVHRDRVFSAREIVVRRFANQRVEREMTQVLEEIVGLCRERSV